MSGANAIRPSRNELFLELVLGTGERLRIDTDGDLMLLRRVVEALCA